MNQRDKVTELLQNYRFYKMAISDYEKPDPTGTHNRITERYFIAGPARVTAYSEMPMGRGSGSRAPSITGSWTWEDVLEYEAYKHAVNRVETALTLLNDNEQSVIKLKWMNGLTFEEIGRRKRYSREWVKKTHKRAFAKLTVCLRFDDVPSVDIKQPVA